MNVVQSPTALTFITLLTLPGKRGTFFGGMVTQASCSQVRIQRRARAEQGPVYPLPPTRWYSRQRILKAAFAELIRLPAPHGAHAPTLSSHVLFSYFGRSICWSGDAPNQNLETFPQYNLYHNGGFFYCISRFSGRNGRNVPAGLGALLGSKMNVAAD
eukprot:3538712-Rhodomonas_salina.1